MYITVEPIWPPVQELDRYREAPIFHFWTGQITSGWIHKLDYYLSEFWSGRNPWGNLFRYSGRRDSGTSNCYLLHASTFTGSQWTFPVQHREKKFVGENTFGTIYRSLAGCTWIHFTLITTLGFQAPLIFHPHFLPAQIQHSAVAATVTR